MTTTHTTGPIAAISTSKCVKIKKHKNNSNIKQSMSMSDEIRMGAAEGIAENDMNSSVTSSMTMTTNKTKKKKIPLSIIDKNRLWDIFDADKCELPAASDATNTIETTESELSNTSNLCKTCDSVLIIMEDGFPTCTNRSCGIICRNTLDYSPEWRFFGADDKNTNDPTRCGNPINPLGRIFFWLQIIV